MNKVVGKQKYEFGKDYESYLASLIRCKEMKCAKKIYSGWNKKNGWHITVVQ